MAGLGGQRRKGEQQPQGSCGERNRHVTGHQQFPHNRECMSLSISIYSIYKGWEQAFAKVFTFNTHGAKLVRLADSAGEEKRRTWAAWVQIKDVWEHIREALRIRAVNDSLRRTTRCGRVLKGVSGALRTGNNSMHLPLSRPQTAVQKPLLCKAAKSWNFKQWEALVPGLRGWPYKHQFLDVRNSENSQHTCIWSSQSKNKKMECWNWVMQTSLMQILYGMAHAWLLSPFMHEASRLGSTSRRPKC